jgi:cell wall-associated NlpC family hydrolase
MKERNVLSKSLNKIALGCIVGTVAFMGQNIVAEASELPVAGIDVVLNAYYENADNGGADVVDFLTSEKLSAYKDMGIAKVSYYVNVRKKPNEKSKILGKLYNNSAAKIICKKGDWYKVKSGSVTGYIKSDYLVTGKKVAKIASKIGTRIATVNTATLKVREAADKDAKILSLVADGDELSVKKEGEDWIKVSDNSGDTGYVSSDYVDVSTEFEEAVSIKEEKERLAEENEAEQNENNDGQTKLYSSGASSLRSNVVNFALKFLGNPYVFGGTSLTNGTDCSGFSQSVFQHFGVSIPRTSRSQAQSGRSVSIQNIKKGDLIFYGKGRSINHVAIYIGNGQVVSASNPREGIKIANYTYRTPYKAVSYLN